MFRLALASSVAAVGLSAGPAVATDYNAIHLEAKGCPRCDITVYGMVERWGEWKSVNQTVSLYDGIGTAMIPRRFNTIGLLVVDPKRHTGWNSVTTVAFHYRGYQPGDRVTNRQSMEANWSQFCMPITEPETFVRFAIVKDRNPAKYKRTDQTWTKYSLRAWANPQIAGSGLFHETYKGRASTQNPGCGYEP